MIISDTIKVELHTIRDKYYNEFVAERDVRKSTEDKIKGAISCFVLNTYNSVISGNNMFVITLRKSDYSEPVIINGNKTKIKISYTWMKEVFKWFVDTYGCLLYTGGNIIGADRGVPTRDPSIFYVSDTLAQDFMALREEGFSLLENVLELRDKNKKPIEFSPTQEESRIMETTRQFNASSSKFTVETEDNIKHNIQGKRIFNVDFNSGGRMYLDQGSIQSISKEDRKGITIDGQETVELDYRALHVMLLYSIENIDYGDNDPYDIDMKGFSKPLSRSLAKFAILIMLNAQDYKTTLRAFSSEIKKYYNIEELRESGDIEQGAIVSYNNILEDIVFKHNKVRDYFYSGIGLFLQSRDSRIMDIILADFEGRGKLAIPIHDSIIVKKEDADLAEEVMRSAFEQVMGVKFNCYITRG